jgi:hypothetical protein
VKFPAVVYSRASEQMSRVAADASHMAPRIVQAAARTKKFATPPRIAHLLEDRFHLHALHTGGFYSAGAGQRALIYVR